MIRNFGIVGLLLVAVAASYAAWHTMQSQSAEKLCGSYPVGTRIGDLHKLPDNFFISRMGPFPIKGNPTGQKIILCEAMTMCDNSCGLEIEDGIVKSASFSSL
jgi:hypothetical protein